MLLLLTESCVMCVCTAGMTLFGGCSPLIMTAIQTGTHSIFIGPGIWMTGGCVAQAQLKLSAQVRRHRGALGVVVGRGSSLYCAGPTLTAIVASRSNHLIDKGGL